MSKKIVGRVNNEKKQEGKRGTARTSQPVGRTNSEVKQGGRARRAQPMGRINNESPQGHRPDQ
jgi:hypothetical protein